MARNYNNKILNSGVVQVGVTYPKDSAVYSSTTGDAYYSVTETTYAGSSDLQDESKWTRKFLWKPSVSTSSDIQPRVIDINLGDNYQQLIEDGFNTQNLDINLSFKNRSTQEIRAISHYLSEFGSWQPFYFELNEEIFETGKRYICKQWSNSFDFKNNLSLNAKFEEYSAKI